MPISASLSPVIIPANGSQSAAFEVANDQIISVYVPAAWTPAPLAVQAALVVGTPGVSDWFTVTDLDGEVSLPAAAGRVLCLPGALLIPNSAHWLRFVSGTVGSPVVQLAERILQVERRSF